MARTGRVVVGAAVAVAVAVVAFVAFLSSETPAGRRTCNGSAELCDRHLDEVALPVTHNSMSATEDRFLYPNQEGGIEAQLEDGVRGFLVDAYLGSVRTVDHGQVVYTELDDARFTRAAELAGPEPTRRALELREQAGEPSDDALREVYLCHQFCELGAVRFSDVVDVLRRFLAEHRGEVLVIVVQDELDPNELVSVIEDGGLAQYVATVDPSRPLPTLGSMVESGERVLVGLENGDLGPRLPNVYDAGLIQETPYDFSSVEQLEDPTSCRRHRGHTDAPLFLLNHWVSPASADIAANANDADLLYERAERCAVERQLRVNLVAVDHYEIGGLAEVVDDLNGADSGQ
jgi:hypothetical protein